MKKNRDGDIKYKSYRFSIHIIQFLQTLSSEHLYNAIVKELFSSSSSIGIYISQAIFQSEKNIALKYFKQALNNANKASYWLHLLRDSNFVKSKDIDNLIIEITMIKRLLNKIVD